MNQFFNNDFFKNFQSFGQNFQAFPPFAATQKGKTQQADFSKLFAAQRKNIEAFAAANQALTEGAQAIARRSAEFLRDQVEESLSASRELMASANAPEKAAARQTDFAKSSVQNTVEQLREVSEMATKTQFEAFDILSSRFTRSVEEVKDFAEKAAA